MAYSTVSNTPAQRPLLDSSGLIDRSWRSWFSSIGDALLGKWGNQSRNLTFINIIPTNEQYISYNGREMTCLFEWSNGVTFSNSTIELDFPTLSNPERQRSDLTVISGMLQVWDGEDLVKGAYVKDNIITLPNINISNRCIVQGTVLTKIK
jgi:hypothetical protein